MAGDAVITLPWLSCPQHRESSVLCNFQLSKALSWTQLESDKGINHFYMQALFTGPVTSMFLCL